MDTLVVAMINCSVLELRSLDVFVRAAEFAKYESTVTIHCTETGECIQVNCGPHYAHCWGWRHFANEWQRKHGPIN